MNPDAITSAITRRTKAILPVHLFGQICDMERIFSIAEEHDLRVIEDCCQAHGAELCARHAPIGVVGAFSFYPGKNLGAYGDAGAVVTHDSNVHAYVVQQRDHGRPLGVKHEHARVGFGFRLDTLQASVLRVKLRHLEEWTEKRRDHAWHYTRRLKDRVKTPIEAEGRRHVFHLYTIRTPQRDALCKHLDKAGINTGIHYPVPLHLQPAYASFGGKRGDLPVTERCADELLSLPIYAELTEAQVDYICDCIIEFFNEL
jgi:dTDP-4-amino-4,6-dideoxygalactose transaminase